MPIDKAEISKMKVADLKAELESRSIEIPKGNAVNQQVGHFMFLGAKKADLVALLEKAEAPTSPPVQAEAENSNDIAQEIEKISAEDDLTKVDEDDDEEEAAAEPKKDEKEPGTCSIESIHQMPQALKL